MKRNLWVDDDALLRRAIEANALCCPRTAGTGVPSIAHFIWLGRRPLPTYAVACMDKFRSLHPLWVIRLWTDESLLGFTWMNGSDAFASSTNYGMKSDILRYELLGQFGGVYMDVDYEVLRPLDELCASCGFFAAFANTPACEISNAMIGSVPGHPLLGTIAVEMHRALLARAQSLTALALSNPVLAFLPPLEQRKLLESIRGPSSLSDTIADTGPGMLTRSIDSFLHQTSNAQLSADAVLLLPCPVLNPVPNLAEVALTALSDGASDSVVGASMGLWDLECSTYNFFVSRNEYEVSDWGAYEEVKDACVRHAREVLGLPVLAIHWWQRSWQE